MGMEGKAHPDCINASNPYHECVAYCFKKIAEAKASAAEAESSGVHPEPVERTVHSDCINASNPFHECNEYCFKKIAEAAKDRRSEFEKCDVGRSSEALSGASPENQRHDAAEQTGGAADGLLIGNDGVDAGNPPLTERQKKLFELRLKMNEARTSNHKAMVAEKNRSEAPTESRDVSKQKWLDDRKKKVEKLLDANGLDMSKAYMLDTQEKAEEKYKKWEKEPAPFGWDVFNQKTLYNAHKKRTANIVINMEEYNKAKEADPEFYRNASSLQYGKVSKDSKESIDRMVKELRDTEAKRKSFSRRRKFHEDKDVDSINERNEHFNKKIERAFGKYTLEIKNNLERGTALPD